MRLRSLGRAYDFCHAVDVDVAVTRRRGFAARGVPVLLDVNEIPDPFERQGARFTEAPEPVKRRLAQRLRPRPAGRDARLSPPATPWRILSPNCSAATRRAIRNARAPLDAPPSRAIRDDAGGGPETCVLAYPCTAAPHLGVETAIETLCRLPEHFRLVFVGRFVTQAYRETVERLIRRLGVGHRVVLKGEVPEPDYLPYLAGADIGLVPLSFAYRNQRVVLPWRVIDLTAAGVPMVASPSDAIRRFARAARILANRGRRRRRAILSCRSCALPPRSPERIAAIKRDLRRCRRRIFARRAKPRAIAQCSPRWRRDGIGRAAFVVNLALRRNRRIIGFIDEACALGWRVDLYCVRAPDREWFRSSRPRAVRRNRRPVCCRASRCRTCRTWPRRSPASGSDCGNGGARSGSRGAVQALRGDWDLVIATDLFALPAGLRASSPRILSGL